MSAKTGDIILSREEIRKKVEELGRRISEDYRGESILMVGILKGAVVFMADLMREIDIPVSIDFMSVASYAGSKSTGVVKIYKDIDQDIQGKNVLIVEDIIDTGLTLAHLKELLQVRNPKSLKIATLLDKKEARKADIEIDYKGFEIGNDFIVGYGLDLDNQFRNLPSIHKVIIEENTKTGGAADE